MRAIILATFRVILIAVIGGLVAFRTKDITLGIIVGLVLFLIEEWITRK